MNTKLLEKPTAATEQHRFTLIELKTDAKTRIVTGYAATWDPDEVGDKLLPTAFDETIKKRHIDALRVTGRSGIRVLWQHEKPIGVLLTAVPDSRGLKVSCRISRTHLGDDALQLLIDGAVDKMSIGYVTQEFDNDVSGLRILKKVDLWEVSFVTFPANTESDVLGVKRDKPQMEYRAHTFVSTPPQEENGEPDMNLEQKAGKKIAGRNIDRLKAMQQHMEAVVEYCKTLLSESEPDSDEQKGDEQKASRSEDAGGRGMPPSNHTVARDAVQDKSGCVSCPNCQQKLNLAGLLPSMGEADPEPESIAGNVAPLGMNEPQPESIAGYPGPYTQPKAEPESIASLIDGAFFNIDQTTSAPVVASPNMGSSADQALRDIAEGVSRPISAYLEPNQSAPGSRPNGHASFGVVTPKPESIASSDQAISEKELLEALNRINTLTALVDQVSS